MILSKLTFLQMCSLPWVRIAEMTLSGCDLNQSMASARAAESFLSHKYPDKPSRTTSELPPTRVATIGKLLAPHVLANA